MDWRSKEGVALLLAAYPDGVLARRGVMSIGPTPAWGWLCVAPWSYSGGSDTSGPPEVDPWAKSSWCRVGEDGSDYPQTLFRSGADNGSGLQGPHSGGILLPMPDPADTATWACLLSDLADARYGTQGPRDGNMIPCLGRALVQQVRDIVTLGWALIQVYPTKIQEDFLPGTYGIADPAEALVRAKIHALECRAKEMGPDV